MQRHRLALDLFAGDRCDEPIARSRHRLDVAARTLIVAERLAQCRDVDGQNAFLDTGFGPHPGQEFILRDEMAGLAEEQGQDVMGFRRKANDLATMCEPPLAHLQREPAEMKDLAAAHDDFGES